MYIIDLNSARSERQVGKKAWSLKKAAEYDFIIPSSLCLSTLAYTKFLDENKLHNLINLELNRKSMHTMRWEELWDCSFRIKSFFQQSYIPEEITSELKDLFYSEKINSSIAVRSSSTQEDMDTASFAGLYDSYINCKTYEDVCNAIINVWASLWSDRALLYRKEIGLDFRASSMGVLLQKMIVGEFSGVAFSRSPNDKKSENMVIEVVRGLCANLVDGKVEPNRYTINRDSFTIVEHYQAIVVQSQIPELSDKKIETIAHIILAIERNYGYPVDVEWTLQNNQVVILQVRPVIYKKDTNQKRQWYLTLTPKDADLKCIFTEIKQELIPKLKSDGQQLQATNIEVLDNHQLADEINSRKKLLHCWRKIYHEKFIPFAHGIRRFAEYYNEIIMPDDPYEFTEVLKHNNRLAHCRMNELIKIASLVENNKELKNLLEYFLDAALQKLEQEHTDNILGIEDGKKFIDSYNSLKEKYFDITLDRKRWKDHDNLIIKIIMSYCDNTIQLYNQDYKNSLEESFLKKSQDKDYSKYILEVGKTSWQLRDDDNLLLGKIESQFYKALIEGVNRLRADNKVTGDVIDESSCESIVKCLLLDKKRLTLKVELDKQCSVKYQYAARQLKGQPAVPGCAGGYAKHIQTLEDIKNFKQGDIIICDAVDPNMTHLVPLSSAIVERRGGMLIHGVIIARELGIPCVNGIDNLLELVEDNDFITVDGDLGLVIVGYPDFSLESGTV